MERSYEIFADYHQFYLWDHDRQPDVALDYDDRDVANRIKAAPFLVVVQPERNMTVPVSLTIGAAPPALVPEDWDHVAEASLDLPSGKLEIHECTGESIDLLSVAPGSYRVRACFAGLDTLSDDGLDGDARYALFLWPAAPAPIAIVKHHAGSR